MRHLLVISQLWRRLSKKKLSLIRDLVFQDLAHTKWKLKMLHKNRLISLRNLLLVKVEGVHLEHSKWVILQSMIQLSQKRNNHPLEEVFLWANKSQLNQSLLLENFKWINKNPSKTDLLFNLWFNNIIKIVNYQ